MIFNFVNKNIKVATPVVRTPGKRVKAIVVWKGNERTFKARVGKELYNIKNVNDISNSKYIYALPTNTMLSPWQKKPYIPPENNDPDILAMTLRFYGKFYHGQSIYGKIVDGLFEFYTKRIVEDEPSISEDNSENN